MVRYATVTVTPLSRPRGSVFFIASEERKGSEVIAPAPGLDAAKKPESTNGGVGDQEKRTDASPAVVVDPKPEASEAAVAKANAVTKAHEEDEVYREKRPSTAKVIKVSYLIRYHGSGFGFM